jgi:transcriptional regulator with XRE-family HTH domain
VRGVIAVASSFWSDLATDLEDPVFLREYVRESVRIATVDTVMNTLDDARLAEGLSKAELARAIGAEPAAVRRLLASGDSTPDPTLGTLVDLATALGLRIRLEPLPEEDRDAVTTPLREGTISQAAMKRLTTLRTAAPDGESAQPA